MYGAAILDFEVGGGEVYPTVPNMKLDFMQHFR